MKTNIRIIPLIVVLLMAGTGCEGPGAASEPGDEVTVDASMCDENDGGITLPDGFCAVVVADTLERLRHIVVHDNGDVYVAHRQATDDGGITALRDTNSDGKADTLHTFGPIAGTGLTIHDGYLYASTDTSVHRFMLSEGLAPTGDPELIVGGLPVQNSHAAKSITIDDVGNLYVNVGGPSNACQQEARSPGSPGQDPCSQLERQGGVWQFRADTPDQTQVADGHRYSTGIRNAVALEWSPTSGDLYAVQHGRDQLHQLWDDLYTEEQSAELPAEELFRLRDGADFGWPYCYYDHQQGRKVLAPEYGGDGQEVGRCADKEDPIATFPGHYAPNDLVFYTGSHFPDRYRNGAFIAFHGSWNRAPLPQEGYQVAFVPMGEDGRPTGEWETFADGFKGTDVLESPGDAAHRPTGLAVGPDGTLYVTDSVDGRIWRIVYAGNM